MSEENAKNLELTQKNATLRSVNDCAGSACVDAATQVFVLISIIYVSFKKNSLRSIKEDLFFVYCLFIA